MGNQLHLNDLDRKIPTGPSSGFDDENDGFASSSTAPLLSVSPEIQGLEGQSNSFMDQPPTYESSVQDNGESTSFGRQPPPAGPGYHSNDPTTNAVSRSSRYSETLCVDKSTGAVTSYDPDLNSDPETLYAFLIEQNHIRPQPLVRMRGTHTEKFHRHNGTNHETTSRTVVDFDLRCDFSNMMILAGEGASGTLRTVEPEDRALRGGRIRTRAWRGPHGHGLALPLEGGRDVKSWVEEYCRSTAYCKEFVMEKSCPGYDTQLISKRLHDLIASTNYRGDVQITFPVLNSKVIVRPSNGFTRFRYNFWTKCFFYVTFLWIITWPLLFLYTKRWNVIRSIWPMSYTTTDGTRQVILSEEDWYARWRNAIRRALLGRRQGFVTDEDLIEAQHEGAGGFRQFNTGSTTADVVLGNVWGIFESYRTPEWGTDRSDGGWH